MPAIGAEAPPTGNSIPAAIAATGIAVVAAGIVMIVAMTAIPVPIARPTTRTAAPCPRRTRDEQQPRRRGRQRDDLETGDQRGQAHREQQQTQDSSRHHGTPQDGQRGRQCATKSTW